MKYMVELPLLVQEIRVQIQVGMNILLNSNRLHRLCLQAYGLQREKIFCWVLFGEVEQVLFVSFEACNLVPYHNESARL